MRSMLRALDEAMSVDQCATHTIGIAMLIDPPRGELFAIEVLRSLVLTGYAMVGRIGGTACR